MYTKEQKKLVSYVRVRVKELMNQYPAKAHGFDHAKRVAKWAVLIATAEHANIFLSEISAWLHDIGRVREEFFGHKKRHHELSYEMCREWFREDKRFDALSKEEKLQILYALRYHWNDMANDYAVAWILRDADKLDGFGKLGLKRSLDFFEGDEGKIEVDLRLRYHTLYNLRSRQAKKIVQEKNMLEPVEKYFKKWLKEKIEPVAL
ncbi:MAG: HD domain-containing protein [Candidatus Magasanikbacteria bacterium]|nr:HD domain-containing protein [Candidatus Magasanikbacteria bacterium]